MALNVEAASMAKRGSNSGDDDVARTVAPESAAQAECGDSANIIATAAGCAGQVTPSGEPRDQASSTTSSSVSRKDTPWAGSRDADGSRAPAGAAITVADVAGFLAARFVGDGDRLLRRVVPLNDAAGDALTFAAGQRALNDLRLSRAAAILVRDGLDVETLGESSGSFRASSQGAGGDSATRQPALIFVPHPQLAFARVLERFFVKSAPFFGIHERAVLAPGLTLPKVCSIASGAVVDEGVVLGERVRIGANAWIGAGVILGDDVCIDAGACIYPGSIIGPRSHVFARAVVGADGFGFADQGAQRSPAGDRWVRIPHLGRVVIGADVEVGAGSTIDRGALSDTVIEDGVKIDNLVHIGHNCRIGADSALAGCVGIAGSAVIGRDCQLAGGVGVVGHTTMANGVTALGMTMVSRSIDRPCVVASGVPHHDARTWNRMLATLRRLTRRSAVVSEPRGVEDKRMKDSK
ncbi:MAG: UDP-3-O-(3-hydroxymyristoyl)glucosamine N-acyltransferase [Thioalkalivibrionaceae bacterium]